MPPSLPPKISTAALQRFLPNAQKPLHKPIASCSEQERRKLLLQSMFNVYNAYESNPVCYKDLAIECVRNLQECHQQGIDSLIAEGRDPNPLWYSDSRDLEIILILLQYIEMGELDTLNKGE